MHKAMTAAAIILTNLCQPLSENGRPAFDTVAKVAQCLGYRIKLAPVANEVAGPPQETAGAEKQG